MALLIEDYALIGDTRTAALVGRNGSIDWLCWPRFDSDACFCALLGDERHGYWRLAPVDAVQNIQRRYRPKTLILETEFDLGAGAVRITDLMPVRAQSELIRVVTGLRGTVAMKLELSLRFGYGRRLPWVRAIGRSVRAVAGPDAVTLCGESLLEIEGGHVVSRFEISRGEQIAFRLEWHPSHQPFVARPLEARRALSNTEKWWSEWSDRCTYRGPWREQVLRSLITLKALTYSPTGGIVAAPTTSLPERLGGVRNWDYRYCWLRDATFTLLALMDAGYLDEARAWRDWLVRAVAGSPESMSIVYGIGGEARLPEYSLPWLPGYEGAAPVRIGNQAALQLQLDVYGEVMDCLHHGRTQGIAIHQSIWPMQRHLLNHLEATWQEPDEGIWEVRGPRRHFTHSKVMAWVAVDRAIKDAKRFNLPAPLGRWAALRARIHQQVCEMGFDHGQQCFVQSYGSRALDASLLMIPLVGFLPATDPRVRGTVAAIGRKLLRGGLVHRYDHDEAADGLPPGEGAFLACSFWYVDNLALLGKRKQAIKLFERLLELSNDVGLLSEEYDLRARRMVGNFPQAFSHVALVNSAFNLSRGLGPSRKRSN